MLYTKTFHVAMCALLSAAELFAQPALRADTGKDIGAMMAEGSTP